MISDEDRGPAWLRDYNFTDFSQIAADISAMEEFASKLAADVENNYVPHLPAVTEAMLTRVPEPSSTFRELCDFVAAHQIAQDTTQQNVYNFANGTYHFASAAQKISADYHGSDAFARAQLKDVDNAFGVTGPPGADAPASGSGSSSAGGASGSSSEGGSAAASGNSSAGGASAASGSGGPAAGGGGDVSAGGGDADVRS